MANTKNPCKSMERAGEVGVGTALWERHPVVPLAPVDDSQNPRFCIRTRYKNETLLGAHTLSQTPPLSEV